MIGLEKGIVRVAPHHPSWHDPFKQERRVLQKHIGGQVLDIQHVGSTAVPGLDAKPIIDIAATVSSPGVIEELRRPLRDLGYIDRGDAGGDGGYLFVKDSAPEVRTHHLHVVAADDPQWRDYLLFRDALRTDETLRARYAELKRILQERFVQDRKGYTDGKHEFIRGVLSAATRARS